MTRAEQPEASLSQEAIGRHLDFIGDGGIEEAIAYKQLEGVAGLWRLLRELNYAYLADEVGMGKTYQALGVLALTWMLNPDARVVVVTPNAAVQNNWAREYDSFMRRNVTACGGRVRDPLTGDPLRPALVHSNLAELSQALLKRTEGLHLVRLGGFKNFTRSLHLEAPSPEHPTTYKKVARLLRRKGFYVSVPAGRDDVQLTESLHLNVACAMMLGPILPRCDLVIIDEAHLLRNRGGNIMTHVLAYLLGMIPPPNRHPALAPPDAPRQPPPTLFLSATPAHRAERDIFNQLANVDPDALALAQEEAPERRRFIAERFVRRLRLFCDQSKYTYRQDTMHEARAVRAPDDPSGDGPSMLDELFFIAAQRCVEQALTDAERDNMNAGVKFGFLECLESYDPEDLGGDGDEGTHYEADGRRTAPDHDALSALVKAYQRAVGAKPPHPKMSLVEEAYRRDVLEGGFPEKMLIFVRRRASVTEIARRVCALYDEHTLAWLGDALGHRFASVAHFEEFANGELGRGESEWSESDGSAPDEPQEAVRSRVLEVFASRTQGVVGASHRFRDRFRASGTLREVLEENLLRLLHRTLGDGRGLEAFLDEAAPAELRERLVEALRDPYYWQSSTLNVGRAAPLIDVRVLEHLCKARPEWRWLTEPLLELIRPDALQPTPATRAPISEEEASRALERLLTHRSLWDVVADRWGESERPDARHVQQALMVPRGSKRATRERLRRRAFLRNIWDKNLRIGEGVLELFCALVAVQEATSANTRLDRDALSEEVAQRLLTGQRHTLWRMAEFARLATPHMERMLEAELGRSQRIWAERAWNVFNQQEPILGVMGGSSSRQRPITQFNTPFFPDVIVCTDVLREGVNLHRCCRRVWHFGMSATPGDIEQRTGRVDRYFSVVHRGLLEDEPTPRERAWLEIGYPYLGRSIDEQQLIQALTRRLHVQPLLDQGTSATRTSDDLDLDAMPTSLESIQERLRLFSLGSAAATPFPPRPAYHDSAALPVSEALTDEEAEAILARLKRAVEAAAHDDAFTPLPLPALAALNIPVWAGDERRDQPIRVSVTSSTGPGTHTLRLETPLGDRIPLAEARRLLWARWPESTARLEFNTEDPDAIWRLRVVLATPLWFADWRTDALAQRQQPTLATRLSRLAVIGDTIERALLPTQDIAWSQLHDPR